jgi:hypothetical protein
MDGNAARGLVVAGCLAGCFWIIVGALLWSATA